MPGTGLVAEIALTVVRCVQVTTLHAISMSKDVPAAIGALEGLMAEEESIAVLPSRSTLQSWNPDALSASGAAVESSGSSVGSAVSGIDDAVNRLPETRGWSGAAHDAATGMFGRADARAQQFSAYTTAVAAALTSGAGTIGCARALLSKADQVEAGPLNVTDQWVVLIDPVLASAEEMAVLQEFALQEQGEIIGAFGGPVAPLTVPLGAVILGGFGAVGGAELGKFVGDVVCPY